MIQEHRRSKCDVDFQGNFANGWQILLGAPSAPGVGGIGFLLSSRCSTWLLDYNFVTDRVAVASFDIGIRRLHVTCVYASTASVTLSDATEFVDFYNCVSKLISNIPPRDLLIVCGDVIAPRHRDSHRVKNSCAIPTITSDHSLAWTGFRVGTSTSLTSQKLIMSCPKFYGLTTHFSLPTFI